MGLGHGELRIFFRSAASLTWCPAATCAHCFLQKQRCSSLKQRPSPVWLRDKCRLPFLLGPEGWGTWQKGTLPGEPLHCPTPCPELFADG